eukprot:CAMPEP_0204635730 /NCGR_PEP_ID=MMETSP0717-20131115/32113_1 /ASSEMBLY_ACC=CAM_ASM_000666 /TAXON_ID=230516 /ORGANISM="Chaetoceros curvisetus" /LENGTH=93 /DNA_ID=CAMNT_0051654545 /DNA_START=383 /DNA_END=661 /DNA_ORIENTATION=-
MAYFGLFSFVVTREWTWKRIVRRDRGAVTVLAADPATPPQKRCFKAETGRESESLGSTGGSGIPGPSPSAAFVSLRIIFDVSMMDNDGCLCVL